MSLGGPASLMPPLIRLPAPKAYAFYAREHPSATPVDVFPDVSSPDCTCMMFMRSKKWLFPSKHSVRFKWVSDVADTSGGCLQGLLPCFGPTVFVRRAVANDLAPFPTSQLPGLFKTLSMTIACSCGISSSLYPPLADEASCSLSCST